MIYHNGVNRYKTIRFTVRAVFENQATNPYNRRYNREPYSRNNINASMRITVLAICLVCNYCTDQ